MIYTSKLKTDLRNREILPGNYEENMFVCMRSSLDRYTHRCIPWHWHDSFEIDYVLQGDVEFRTSESSQLIRQGDIFFVNHGVMHEYQGIEGSSCVVCAILFDSHLLSGIYNSLIERKYILPIKESGMEYFAFSPDSEKRLEMARSVLNAIELLKNEPAGYEMLLRSELSNFWVNLFSETADIRKNSEKLNTSDKERIKKMLEFIHTSYAEKITTESIALSADVSVRECTRCFSRCIGMPPNKYLNEYRIHVAAEMLLETDLSVLEISENCGFSSSSYFSKAFVDAMNCTPREYRISGGIIPKNSKAASK